MKNPSDRPCPAPLFPDDVFIVSYPKSGSTWARFMLANCLSNNTCDFKSVSCHIPDLHYSAQLDAALPRPRLIKSHFPLDTRYPRVIYIARDGRDVAVSYYYHVLRYHRVPEGTSFATYLNLFHNGGLDDYGPWGEHVLSWLDNRPKDFLLLRYEDMKADPDRALLQMLEFAGCEIAEGTRRSAVEASSFSRMQSIENRQRNEMKQWAGTDPSIQFVRKGATGEHRKHFDAEMYDAFERRHRDALIRLGYLER